MSVKYFCDQCGEEITARNRVSETREFNRLRAVDDELSIEIITSFKGIINDGTFCKYCVIDAVNQADDRPRQEAASLAMRLRNQLDEMVDRFLGWPVPDGVASDPCAADPAYKNRIGTNFLDATTAKAMLVYVLGLDLDA